METNDNIIQLLGSGYTVKEVAAMTNLTFWGVKKRIRTMMKKYDCKTVTQLVVNYLRLNDEKVKAIS